MWRSICAASYFFVWVGLFSMMSFTLSAQTTQPSISEDQPFLTDQQVWKAYDRPRNVKKLRLSGPRYVYKDTIDVAVHAPKRALKPGVTFEVSIALVQDKKSDDTEITSTIVEFPAEAWPPEERRHPRQKERWYWRAQTTVMVKDMPDGEYEINLRKRDEKKTLRTMRFRIVRSLINEVNESKQAELKVWLDDANSNQVIWGKIPLWRNLPTAMRQAQSPYKDMRGFMLRSYYNPQIQRLQPYTVYVPKSLDMAEPAPLMILLHGSGGDYRNIIADFASGQRLEKHPMIIANAGMFKHEEYRHLALNDVRWIIEDMKKKYNIDASRIYLQGISLGGRGTLEAAALLPDVFAAISAHGVYGIQEGLEDPFKASRMDPISRNLAVRADMRTFLPNLFNTPTEIIYGWTDPNTPPGLGLMFYDQLRVLNMKNLKARGFDTGHNLSLPHYDWASTRKWLLQHRLNHMPTRIMHRVDNLRFGKNKWLDVKALHDYTAAGSITASYDDENKSLMISTDNIQRVQFQVPFDVSGIIYRLDDGSVASFKQIEIKADQGFTLELTIEDDGEHRFRLLTRDQSKLVNVKHKYDDRAGPIWDVWSKPAMTVYAEAEGDMGKVLKASAEYSVRRSIAWGDQNMPVKALSELTEDEKKSMNIILFTTPERVDGLEDLKMKPWPVDKQLDQARDAWVKVQILPSPWSETNSVVIVTLDQRCRWPISLGYLGSWDAAFRADWLMVQPIADRQGRLRSLQIRAAGSFKHDWSFGAYTTKDFRQRSLLGPAARGQ